jgi:hypothetical protein
MKQTAVEEAIELIKQDYLVNGRLRPSYVFQVLEQAKEMEKEIIRTAYLDGMDGEYNTSEQYYNETFKSE